MGIFETPEKNNQFLFNVLPKPLGNSEYSKAKKHTFF